jgi:hypothetical protein
MPALLVTLGFLLVSLQEPSPPTVHRVFVTTPYNPSIIFEYANVAIPEGEPLKLGAVECLTSQLLATGLFSNAQVNLKPTNGGHELDVDIVPTWVESRNGIVIREISIEDSNGINDNQLKDGLRRRGLRVNSLLLHYPLPSIRNMVLASVRDMYHEDFSSMNDAEEMLADLSFRIEPLAAQAVRLRIIVGKKPLCE